MTDNLTSTQRRRLMGRVRCRDTAPEIRVRKIAHRLGFRFRLYRRDLPGTPDLVFPRHKKVIFVHGCFWHQHDCPRGSTTRYQPRILGPETRPEHPAGYRQRESAPTTRMGNTRSLGMRNQAHGRAGAPHKRVSRYDEIEIDQPSKDIDQLRTAFPTTSLPRDAGRSLPRNARQTWEERRCL